MRNCFIIAVGAVWLASPASAVPIVDQDTGLSPNGSGSIAVVLLSSAAQTLTVGQAGSLTQIDIQIYQSSGAIGDVTLELLSLTGGGLPDSSSPLFSTVISISSLPVWDSFADGQVPWTSLDVSSAGLSFNVGDEFAVALSRSLGPAGAPPWVAWVHHADDYAGGIEFFDNTPNWLPNGIFDASVRTWVAPIPEPSTALLVSLGMVGLAVRRRRMAARAR